MTAARAVGGGGRGSCSATSRPSSPRHHRFEPFSSKELIIMESSLSFLGLGVQPPTPRWGGMISEGREYVGSAWWLSAIPGLAIAGTVLGANLFGDALRRSLDPRLRGVS